MGYTPLFDTMLSGTLYGRWPHTGVWACLLSRVSREGVIDETPQCLAGAIGIPVELLKECIHDFMQPDPESRTAGNDGRRLELIDPERSWGWRVINAGKYKEKARKRNYDERRTETGDDAARKRAERDEPGMSRDVPTPPDVSRSHSHSHSHIDTEGAKAPVPVKIPKTKKSNLTALPPDFELTAAMSAYATEHLPGVDAAQFFEIFVGRAKAKNWKYADWVQAFQVYVRNCSPNSSHFAKNDYPKLASRRYIA